MSNGEQVEFALWVLLAFALGAIIGLQREIHGHAAGVRTCALVCGGSATFGMLSFDFAGDDRIAAGVVQGIGFLGAGLILQRDGSHVRGVTTAATVWVVAAVGLVVSRELWVTALMLTGTVVLVLQFEPLLERFVRNRRRHAGIDVESDSEP